LAEELLYAEARLGEMLAEIDKSKSYSPSTKGSAIGSQKTLPPSITHKDSHYAQTLHKHEDVIVKVIAEARDKGEVPVRQHVLKAVKNSNSTAET